MSDLDHVMTQLQTAGLATVVKIPLAELVAACVDLGLSTREVFVTGRASVVPPRKSPA